MDREMNKGGQGQEGGGGSSTPEAGTGDGGKAEVGGDVTCSTPTDLRMGTLKIVVVGSSGADSGATGVISAFEQQELHPMHNPVILGHLFDRCPSQLLAKLRLVSKQWRDLSLTTWRSSFPVKLYLKEGRLHVHENTTLEQFLEYMGNPQSKCDVIPFRCLKLDKLEITTNNLALQLVWKTFGKTVTSLEINRCQFTDMEEFRKVIYKYFPKLEGLYLNQCTFPPSPPQDPQGRLKYKEPVYGEHPNLQHLNLSNVKKDLLGKNFGPPVPWIELLSHFQSLTSFSFSATLWGIPEPASMDILNAIGIVREHDGLRLRHLDFEVALTLSEDEDTHEKFTLLRQLQLPLASLWIDQRPELDDGMIKEVLEFHADTLRKITACQDDQNKGAEMWLHEYGGPAGASGPWIWKLPCQVELTNLQELEMLSLLCENMEFLKYTPNLRKLEFSSGDESFHNTMTFMVSLTMLIPALADLKMRHLTEFRLDYVVMEEDVSRLIGIMPHVEKLKMRLTDKQFEVVCGGWTKLKLLEVLGNELTDEGVTEKEGYRYHARPNITHLQDLESFGFHSKHLRDDSVLQGFGMLPKLKYLHIISKRMPLGDAAKKSLQGKKMVLRTNKLWD